MSAFCADCPHDGRCLDSCYRQRVEPRETKSLSWFDGLISRVTRKWRGTKHELDQWQDAIEQIRKNK